MKSFFYFLVATLVLLLSQSFKIASAQESAMEEIRVSADPLSDVDEHFTQPVHIMDKEELKRRSVQNIGETVSGQLGVTSSDFGAGVGRPIIRGLGGGRIKVMEDSIGTMDASSTSNDHAVTTEPVFAEQVEILRGPATLLYGSGTSGGLINIVNNRILEYVPQALEGEALMQYETVADGFLGAASLNAGGNHFAIHLDGVLRDRDDYAIPGFAELEPDAGEIPGTLENSGVESENVNTGISYIGDVGFAGFSISHLSTEYGIPGHHHHHGEEEEGGVTLDMEQTRYDFKAAWDEPLKGIRKIKTRWGYNDYEHVEVEPDGAAGTLFDNDELEGRIEILHDTLGNNWDGVVGMQLNSRDFSATGEEAFVPPSKHDAVSLFILEKGDYGNWHFETGLRYEAASSATSTGLAADHEAISVSGGVNWDYLDGYQAGLSVGRTQRVPAIEELFANGPHLSTNAFEIGDSSLGEETSTNVELVWKKTTGRFTLTANLFYNRINDFIFQQEQDLNGDGVADRVEEDFSGDVTEVLDPDEDEEPLLLFHVQDDAGFLGFELEGIVNLFNNQRGNLDLRLWSDYVGAELDNGQNLPRITPWRIGMEWLFERGPWFASLAFTYTGDQNDTAPLETATDGYELLNIHIARTLEYADMEFTVFARGTNLLDEEIRRHTSFVKNIAPLPGRSAIAGIRASF